MGFFDFLDRDNDGSALDDAATGAANAGGALLLGGGVLAAGAGGVMLGGGMAATATGIGAFLGVPAGVVGGGLLGLGAGAAVLGEGLMSSTGNAMAEEAGDFTADLIGSRGPSPYPSQPNQDPHYASGRTDGLGQRMHRRLAEHGPAMGNPTPVIPGLND